MANPRTKAKLEARILERAATAVQFEIKDPRASFITVTRVELSTDLTSGKVYYSVLGGDGERSKAAHMLADAAGFLQRQIARVLHVRRMPHLRWMYDDSLEHAQHVEDLIREARARDREINPHVDDADAAHEVEDLDDEDGFDELEDEDEDGDELEDEEADDAPR
jgi:ribosome-binding factor A